MSLYRSFFAVGGLTLISRVLGFVRDVLIAAVLGTGAVADAFFVAFRLPNLFRRLFAEGAFNSAFVPLFAKKLEGEGPAAAKRFAEDAMSGLAYVLLILSAVAIGGMPWLMLVLAPGYVDDAQKFEMSVLFGRIAFPYLFCMSLMALYAGVLSSLGKYAAAAAAQILLNVVLTTAIAIAYVLGLANTPEAGWVLAIAVSVAGVVQLAMIARDAAKNGMVLSPRWPQLTPDVRRLVSLGIPALIAGGVTQINIVVGTSIASWQDGAVSYLYYADRLYQLPLGIVGIAVGVVLLSDVSRLLRAGDMAAVAWSQNRSIEFALMVTLPAAVALAVVPVPIIGVLFERGAFTAADTPPTALALAAFAAGLPAFVLARVLSPVYFAREDTRTPMRFATINMLINVALSIGLFFLFKSYGWFPHVGIAIATTVAGWVNAIQLWWTLRQRGDFAADSQLARRLPLIVLSSLLMGAALVGADNVLAPMLAAGQPIWLRVAALAALVAAGLLTYAVLILGTGVLKVAEIREMMRRKKDERGHSGGPPPNTTDIG
ncbi:MAG: murein biosynthesis integral membrane protein MurJ [Hyphomicrobiaceae bacterium]|nr:murein biosynthesis integral membrane protein MurJ [Hyphomicrobiaceae bacterium]